MGTRSLTRVIPRQKGLSYDEGHKHVDKSSINMYRQYDGYPQGHGLELAEFLSDFTVVNGLGADSYQGKIAKDGPGNVYLEALDDGDHWEEYIYTLFPKEGEPTFISIYDVYAKECIFVGTSADLQSKYDD